MNMSNNRDRGNIKWTAMMLTEHVKLLREWHDSDKDVPEPTYDECESDDIAEEINNAYKAQSNVRIKYWINKRSEVVEGQIIELLPQEQMIKVMVNNNIVKLNVRHILKIDTYD